jgi:hypothetical protein
MDMFDLPPEQLSVAATDTLADTDERKRGRPLSLPAVSDSRELRPSRTRSTAHPGWYMVWRNALLRLDVRMHGMRDMFVLYGEGANDETLRNVFYDVRAALPLADDFFAGGGTACRMDAPQPRFTVGHPSVGVVARPLGRSIAAATSNRNGNRHTDNAVTARHVWVGVDRTDRRSTIAGRGPGIRYTT